MFIFGRMSDVPPLSFAQFANAVVRGIYKDIDKFWIYILKNLPKLAAQIRATADANLAKLDKSLVQ